MNRIIVVDQLTPMTSMISSSTEAPAHYYVDISNLNATSDRAAYPASFTTASNSHQPVVNYSHSIGTNPVDNDSNINQMRFEFNPSYNQAIYDLDPANFFPSTALNTQTTVNEYDSLRQPVAFACAEKQTTSETNIHSKYLIYFNA